MQNKINNINLENKENLKNLTESKPKEKILTIQPKTILRYSKENFDYQNKLNQSKIEVSKVTIQDNKKDNNIQLSHQSIN